MIEIASALALNTVQDLGRQGQRHLGVGTAGAMDAPSLHLGNLLVGNLPGDAGIEIQTFPFELRFLADARFAATGAGCAATLDGRPFLPWWRMRARRGQLLRLNPPARGARAYVAVAGGIEVPQVLGSRSTDLRSGFGGFEGRFLQRGDRLPVGASAEASRHEDFGLLPHAHALPLADSHDPHDSHDGVIKVCALRAGEHELFPAPMQRAFWESEWRVGHQSDRTGYRLSGPPLTPASRVEMRSYGVVPGLVQVPPGGQPIVQLSDANTAGGYPKIATVIGADLWRLGQARAGARLRFVAVEWRQAVDAQRALDAFLAHAEAGVAAL